MRIRLMKTRNEKQQGFTLVETLIAVAISGLILSGLVSGFYQMTMGTSTSNARMLAINYTQNAGEWLSRDARNAEDVTLSGNYPTFTWHDYGYTDDAHKSTVVYYLDGNNLRRSYQYGIALPGDATLICQYTVIDSASFSDSVLSVFVTSTVGSGPAGQTQTRRYLTNLRNAS
jgi:prepilin-type N-terminal cleavage/methylation domain-containing protein